MAVVLIFRKQRLTRPPLLVLISGRAPSRPAAVASRLCAFLRRRLSRFLSVLGLAFPVSCIFQQLFVLVSLLLLRARLPPPSPKALPTALGAMLDVVFAVGALVTIDPMECPHFDRGAASAAKGGAPSGAESAAKEYCGVVTSNPPPAVYPRTFRRRLARMAAFARWLVFVPTASRALLFAARSMAESSSSERGEGAPNAHAAFSFATASLFHALRILQ